MALITCPECGRQNVSDSAAACPECGYAIREHFEKIKAEEDLKKQQEEKEKNKEKEAIRKKAFEKDRRAKAINDLKKKMLRLKIGLVALALMAVITIVLQFLTPDSETGASIVFFMVFGVVVYYLIEIAKIKQDIKLAEVDIDQYETKVELENIKKQNSKKCPACPNCGSKNTKRISTVSRAVSAETLGFASAKIGKQYQCNDCNHLW